LTKDNPSGKNKKNEINPSNEVTAKIDVSSLREKLTKEVFREGQQIPERLWANCKKNTYGGFSLKYQDILYILDSYYCVEVVRDDSDAGFNLSGSQPTPLGDEDEKSKTILFNNIDSILNNDLIVLNKGDYLPDHLKNQCEVDMSAGGGSRIKIGPYLYLLDNDFKVTAKMKLTISE